MTSTSRGQLVHPRRGAAEHQHVRRSTDNGGVASLAAREGSRAAVLGLLRVSDMSTIDHRSHQTGSTRSRHRSPSRTLAELRLVAFERADADLETRPAQDVEGISRCQGDAARGHAAAPVLRQNPIRDVAAALTAWLEIDPAEAGASIRRMNDEGVLLARSPAARLSWATPFGVSASRVDGVGIVPRRRERPVVPMLHLRIRHPTS